MNSSLVYSSCGQPQNDFDSLLDAKGKYSWIWLKRSSKSTLSVSADVHGGFYNYFCLSVRGLVCVCVQKRGWKRDGVKD